MPQGPRVYGNFTVNSLFQQKICCLGLFDLLQVEGKGVNGKWGGKIEEKVENWDLCK